MIVEFRVANYRSFLGQQVLSFRASSDRSLQENIVSEGGERLLRTVLVIGSNASGKSNLVKAMQFMAQFVQGSFAWQKPNDPIAVDVCLLSAESQKRPSEFGVTFIWQGVRYQYDFAVTAHRVTYEALYFWPHHRRSLVFERRWDSALQQENYHFGVYMSGDREMLKSVTRPNALFVSTGAALNHALLGEVYRWFGDSNMPGGRPIDAMPYAQFNRLLKASPHYRPALLQLLKAADFTIVDYELREMPLRFFTDPPPEQAAYADVMAELLQLQPGGEERPINRLSLILKHVTRDGTAYELESFQDSAGTQKYLYLALLLLMRFDDGRLLIADEFDGSLHPLLCREYIRLFHTPEVNTRGAQLLAVTHDTSLISTDLVRRDQVWLVEKGDDGASEIFSLAEIGVRKDESLQRGYLLGRYGAVPYLGDFQLAVEMSAHNGNAQ